MNGNWMAKAAWYELAASLLLDVKRETAEALTDGEFAGAFEEIAAVLGLEGADAREATGLLATYVNADAEGTFHELRKEHTRLFIVGAGHPLVQPYAGVWRARQRGRKALLLVGEESMAIERFMRRCGVSRPDGYGGPVDDAGTILEFLSVLCLRVADALANREDAQAALDDYAEFYQRHFYDFSQALAQGMRENSTSNALRACALMLEMMPEEAL